MRRCLWSRNLKNEETIARVEPQQHREENYLPLNNLINPRFNIEKYI
jgi:hypothetical protein